MIYPELLRDATDDLVKRLMFDDNYVEQEKHNGDRRVVSKVGDIVQDYNRHAERGKGLSPEIVAALKRHPLPQFVIDCEFVTHENRLHVFDALHLGDYNIVNDKYRTRLSYLHSAFDGFDPYVAPIYTAFTPAEKVALYERLLAEFAEGFVMKDLNAPYRQSNRAGTLRYNWRYKFVKTLDAVVIGDSTERDDKGMLKNSVRLGLFTPNGHLRDICGATKKSIYLVNGGPEKSNTPLQPGDVTEVAYLYGTGSGDIVQPRLLGKRTDKRPEQCTIGQIVVNKNWRKK